MKSYLSCWWSFLFCVACLARMDAARGQLQVDADFPGGSGEVLEIDQQSCTVRILPADFPKRGWRCWWYVKVSGLVRGEIFTLEVGDAPWATPDRATFSVDAGQSWQQSDPGVRDGKRIKYQVRADAENLQIAWGPPFVPSDAQSLVDRLADSSSIAQAFVLCRTRENRPTPALRINGRSESATEDRRPLIWIQARQHAWESGSSWVCRGFAEWLLSDSDSARTLRKHCEIVVVPVMDIDNAYHGAGGKGQHPQDHNRDWSDQPYWRSVEAAQLEIGTAAAERRLAAFIDLHNPSARDRQPYFYVPPRDLLAPKGRENLDAFLDAARQEITGPLKFSGRVIESGQSYDPKMWSFISKNWVARLGTPAVSVTLETAWNTNDSTTDGYLAVGRQLGETLARTVGKSAAK